MKKTHVLGIAILAVVFLSGCAAGPNIVMHTPALNGDIAGFWLGLWHGMISPITFIVSIFRDDVSIYEVHNSGVWYNFGFVLGDLILYYKYAVSTLT